jgi:hypothetical protein
MVRSGTKALGLLTSFAILQHLARIFHVSNKNWSPLLLFLLWFSFHRAKSCDYIFAGHYSAQKKPAVRNLRAFSFNRSPSKTGPHGDCVVHRLETGSG